MSRYFIYLAYKGTHYCGWQNQPNGISIQQKIEETLSVLLRQAIRITGAGRTDAGVHACFMVAHFDVAEKLDDTSLLTGKLNKMLPNDVAVHQIVPVIDSAHARFDALSRTYVYKISDKKNPFHYESVCRMSLHAINFERMNEACTVLFEFEDFTSFSKLHTDTKTNHCRIIEAEWKKTEEAWVFTITADRFLRNMVRAIVGTLLDVGRGKLTIDDFRSIIRQRDRCKAGMSVPAEGLALTNVAYPKHIFKSPFL